MKIVRRRSPVTAVDRRWASQLEELFPGDGVLQWSDHWTDEDIASATTASLARFEEQESE